MIIKLLWNAHRLNLRLAFPFEPLTPVSPVLVHPRKANSSWNKTLIHFLWVFFFKSRDSSWLYSCSSSLGWQSHQLHSQHSSYRAPLPRMIPDVPSPHLDLCFLDLEHPSGTFLSCAGLSTGPWSKLPSGYSSLWSLPPACKLLHVNQSCSGHWHWLAFTN